MGTETERKFLVDHEKWRTLKKPKGVRYRQGYLADDKELTLRIRIAGKQGFITIKGESTGISRSEFEYKIPAKDATQLLSGFALSELKKTRYRIRYSGKLWEVDEFADKNEGLIMAEIELENEDEPFEKPDWITQEVSDDKRYYNSYLAKHPFKSW